MAATWSLRPGETIKRVALHKEFGGRTQGGIGPSARTDNVFVFTDPEVGVRHGYYDDWLGDGCFHYTGEGQRGDQQMKSGNAAILHHRQNGKALRLFKGARGVVTYFDEFEIDDVEPFYRTDAEETGGGPRRQVIVFRLRPRQIKPEEARSRIAAILTGPARVDVPIEQQHTERAYVAPGREPYEAERREQKLVLELDGYLRAHGHNVCRQQILPPGEARPVLTDLFDATTGLLVEAKGTVQRNAIRMAIGQLLDYKRFIEPTPNHLAVLVPEEPRRDLCDLLASQGIDHIFPSNAGFEDSTGGALLSG